MRTSHNERYVAVLPGRRSWPVVCHAGYLDCPECLRRIAAVLAREIGFDVKEALDRTSASYQSEICGAVEHGHELRRLTVAECFLRHPDFSGFARGTTAGDVFVVDDLETTPNSMPALSPATFQLAPPPIYGRGVIPFAARLLGRVAR